MSLIYGVAILVLFWQCLEDAEVACRMVACASDFGVSTRAQYHRGKRHSPDCDFLQQGQTTSVLALVHCARYGQYRDQADKNLHEAWHCRGHTPTTTITITITTLLRPPITARGGVSLDH